MNMSDTKRKPALETQANRRSFLKMMGLAAAGWAMPAIGNSASAASRVLVIGGGFGGATVAKYLKLWGDNIDVTLIDRDASHYACILSNLVITGALNMEQLKLGYGNLQTRHGVKFAQGEALAIDPGNKTVAVAFAGEIKPVPYDKLVLAPGIEFIPPAGNYNPDLTPHAWKAGAQTLLLQKMLASMSSNQTFVMTIPGSPYRCPPGPYERACSVADYLKTRKPGAKVVVLDENPGIQAEPVNFGNAFKSIYGSMLKYIPNAKVLSVDSSARTVVTSVGTYKGAVLNIIPAQRAGKLVTDAGLVNDSTGRWALVDPLSYVSKGNPDIHILGDSQGTLQPKSGHMANSQAKVCADALIRASKGELPDPSPVTSSACFSPITATKAAWLTASFRYDPLTKAMKRVDASFAEAKEPTSDGMQQMYQWANNIFADSFG